MFATPELRVDVNTVLRYFENEHAGEFIPPPAGALVPHTFKRGGFATMKSAPYNYVATTLKYIREKTHAIRTRPNAPYFLITNELAHATCIDICPSTWSPGRAWDVAYVDANYSSTNARSGPTTAWNTVESPDSEWIRTHLAEYYSAGALREWKNDVERLKRDYMDTPTVFGGDVNDDAERRARFQAREWADFECLFWEYIFNSVDPYDPTQHRELKHDEVRDIDRIRNMVILRAFIRRFEGRPPQTLARNAVDYRYHFARHLPVENAGKGICWSMYAVHILLKYHFWRTRLQRSTTPGGLLGNRDTANLKRLTTVAADKGRKRKVIYNRMKPNWEKRGQRRR